MFIRQLGGVSPSPGLAAGARVLQLLPDDIDSFATQRVLDVALGLRAMGGEMVVAGANAASAPFRRAGIDHRPYSASRSSVFQASTTQALLDTVDQRDLALIHVHGSQHGLEAKALASAVNLPLVMTVDRLPQVQGFLGRRTARKHLSGRPIITRSEDIARALIRDFGVPADAVNIVPPGLNMDDHDPSVVTTERSIALAQTWGLTDDPRPVVLVPEATDDAAWLAWICAAATAELAPDTLWILIGLPGCDADAARARIAQSPASGRVAFFDTCPDWTAAMKMSAVVACLPTGAGHGRDRALAAQAMGRAVIATDTGSGSEVIEPGKTGWLIRHRDAGSLSYAVSAALDRDEVICRAMAMAARAMVRSRYSVTTMQRATAEIYAAAIAAHARL